MKQKHAFTLIELLVVTAIVVIFVSMAAPRFKRTFLDLETKETAYGVYKLLLFIREKSVTTGTEHRLQIDENAKILFAEQKASRASAKPELGASPDGFLRIQGKAGKNRRIPTNLQLFSTVDQLRCYPDGLCDSGRIKIKGAESAYEIEVDALGSGIEVKEL